MTFEQYFQLIKEDPDTVNFIVQNKNVELSWKSTKARPFGFINWNATFTFKGQEYSFFENKGTESLLIGNYSQTHFEMVNEFIENSINISFYYIDSYENDLIMVDMDNQDDVQKITDEKYRYKLPINSHRILMPCGRIWSGVKAGNVKFNLISFWRSDIEITKEMIESILNESGIEEGSWDAVYLEFAGDEINKTRLTFGELKNKLNKNHEKQKGSIQNSEMAHLAAGFGAAFKDKKGAGSLAQGKKASKAGIDSVAKYRNTRFPHQESKQQIPITLQRL